MQCWVSELGLFVIIGTKEGGYRREWRSDLGDLCDVTEKKRKKKRKRESTPEATFGLDL